MITRIRRNASVERDIIEIARWIGADRREAALRFFAAAEESITGLQFLPRKGSPKQIKGKGLVDVRTWHVPGFNNYLILYDFRPAELYILAVVDGRRRYTGMIRKRAVD